MKIISADEAALLIKDECTIALSGSAATSLVADRVLRARKISVGGDSKESDGIPSTGDGG